MSFIQLCCEKVAKSHIAKDKSGRGRRRSREQKGNQGVRDFRFINILQLFLFASFLQLLYFIFFFFIILFLTHDIYPHPRPTTFNYTLVNSRKILKCVSKNSSFFERGLIFSFRWILIKVTGRFDTSVDLI